MRRLTRWRPSPAIVVAVLALVAALAGSAVAEVATTARLDRQEKQKVKKIANKQIDKRLPIDAAELGDGAVTTPKLADAAVTTAKIANNAVTTAKLSGDFLQGPVRQVVAVSETTTAAGDTRVVQADCPAGERLIAGGAAWTTTGDNRSTVNGILRVSRPIPSTEGLGVPTGWQASGQVENNLARQLRAYAICLPG
jgi:hypothetical protein